MTSRLMTKDASKEAVRAKIKDIFGELPERPTHLSGETIGADFGFAAGGATLKSQRLIIDLDGKTAYLNFSAVIPNAVNTCPAIIYIGNEDAIPNKFLPAEEIIDRGYSIFSLNINRVAGLDDSFKGGIAGYIAKSRRKRTAPGKIMLWTWAVTRIIDYIYSLDFVDKANIAVAGHGLMALPALISAGQDNRIAYAISNDPGAPILAGEADLASKMPYLFSPLYAENPEEKLLSTLLEFCKEQNVLWGSAKDKPYADIEGEIKLIKEIGGDKIAYHHRQGTEYFSRKDWNIYLDFIDKNLR